MIHWNATKKMEKVALEMGVKNDWEKNNWKQIRDRTLNNN